MGWLIKHKEQIIYLLTLLVSAGLLLAGWLWISPGIPEKGDSGDYFTAVVTQIIEVTTNEYELSDGSTLQDETIAFSARIDQGRFKNTVVTAFQQQDSMMAGGPKNVDVNDRVLLVFTDMGDGNFDWYFAEYHRSGDLLWLGVIFLLLLLLFGRRQGVNTILSLLITCLAVFMIFVPSILAGKNIYIMAVAVCIFSTLSTLLLVSGWSRKTLCAIAGCLGGLAVTAGITLLMSRIMHLTGLVDDQAYYLTLLDGPSIDLVAIIFGAILVGALGAVMDVSMSLASSLQELASQMEGKNKLRVLLRSGMTIGKDIMGTMANTLILAYIGSSLSVVLLLAANEASFLSLLNREMIIVEILQALAGSLGILSTIPITSLLAAWFYDRAVAK